MKLLAIDTATKKLGFAFFEGGILKSLGSVHRSYPSRQLRSKEIVDEMMQIMTFMKPIDIAIIEDPLLRGKSNNTMQRIIGMLEYNLMKEGVKHIIFINPKTVKKRIGGSGEADKLELAMSAGELLKGDNEKNYLADAIAKEDFDATDACAIGLSYLVGEANGT